MSTSTANPLRDGTSTAPDDPQMKILMKHVSPGDIPASEDLYSAADLENEAHLRFLDEPPFSVIAVGDIMLGDRMERTLASRGADYPFGAIRPLLRRAHLVLGNLEGPLARDSPKRDRRYSYQVDPDRGFALTRAGIDVLTLANNHALDCGESGILETLGALADAGARSIGAGANEASARAPAIAQAGLLRVGFLGYYWNRRYAATENRPGLAIGSRDALRTDIENLRGKVDRVVVAYHWGTPYEREPSPKDRARAHHAVDCGADVVVGHHPHVLQPFEIYRGRPIFYSVGNFTFGSRNSRAEGLLVGFRFEDARTVISLYPLYVKNRDPRVRYQPKVLRGACAERMLRQLADISGPAGSRLRVEAGRGILDLSRSETDLGAASS